MKFKLNIETVQKTIQRPIKRNCTVIGLDLASRTGYVILKTNKKTILLDCDFIKVNTSDIYEKLNSYLVFLQKILKEERLTIIEDCFVGINPKGSIFLAKLEGMAYAIAKILQPKLQPKFVHASEARKTLGCLGNAKKEEVAKWIENKLNLKIEDPDIADAILLAFFGALA